MARKSENSGSAVVWVHGYLSDSVTDVWYKFDLEAGKLDLVAELDSEVLGSWTVMGEDVYWAAGFPRDTPRDGIFTKLLKHNIRENSSSSWVTVNPPMKYPRNGPLLVPVDDRRRKRLYVLRGNCGDQDWGMYCGELYNPHTKRWDPPLKGSVLSHSCFAPGQAVFIRGKHSTRVVFYSFTAAALLFYNLNKGSFRLEKYHQSLRITTPSNGLDPNTMNLSILKDVSSSMLPAATDSSFYWFTYDLYFYAYNFLRKKWLRSSRLQIPNWDPMFPGSFFTFAAVVHLCNREFIVVHRHIATQLFAIHSFTIDQLSDSLQVTYKHCYPFPDHSPDFVLCDAIATLKLLNNNVRRERKRERVQKPRKETKSSKTKELMIPENTNKLENCKRKMDE